MDAEGLGLIERPCRCFGAPGGDACIAPADLVAIQLRPDASGRPVLAVIGSCRRHARSVVTYLRASWPHDDVDTYSVDVAEHVLAELVSGFGRDGVALVSEVGVA